jgi:hypothetical protein
MPCGKGNKKGGRAIFRFNTCGFATRRFVIYRFITYRVVCRFVTYHFNRSIAAEAVTFGLIQK